MATAMRTASSTGNCFAQLRVEDLECDAPIVLDVAREKNRRHAPAPDLAIQEVGGSECSLQLIAN